MASGAPSMPGPGAEDRPKGATPSPGRPVCETRGTMAPAAIHQAAPWPRPSRDALREQEPACQASQMRASAGQEPLQNDDPNRGRDAGWQGVQRQACADPANGPVGRFPYRRQGVHTDGRTDATGPVRRCAEGHCRKTDERKVQASVARCLRTPPCLARDKGLKVSVWLLLTQQRPPEHDCRWQLCCFGPITVVPHRDKANPFTRSSILFRPHVPPTPGVWWSRRVPPPGPIRLLRARLCP